MAQPNLSAPQQDASDGNKAAQLRATLAQAQAAYAAGNATPPARGNAFDLYRAALELDRNDPLARAGIERIVGDQERRVGTALGAQNAPEATRALASLRSVAPSHPRLSALQTEITALARRSRSPQPAVSRSSPVSASAPKATTPSARPPAVPAKTATPNLTLAKAYLAANQLIEPVDASALTQLRQARAAGEDESAVQIAATDLGTRLSNRALAAISAADPAEAKAAYEAAASLDREFETALPELDSIAARVRELEAANQRASAANDRLARVTKLRGAGQLIEPAGDNAYDALKAILADDAASPEVRTEQQRLSFALLESTRTALAAGDIDRADVLTTRAEEIQPGLPQTKVLREQIGAARAERDDRDAVLQAASLPRRRQTPAIYPREALLDKTEGWVDLEFVITVEGVPTEIAVKSAQPTRVFDTAATQALRQWRFEPILRNGVAQTRRATLRMEFKLAQ
jgi:TonB family protein